MEWNQLFHAFLTSVHTNTAFLENFLAIKDLKAYSLWSLLLGIHPKNTDAEKRKITGMFN